MRIGTAGGTIGRSPNNTLVLADPDRYVGRQHARIGFRDGVFFLTDTSTNGIFVNNAAEWLSEGQEVELHDGDELSIGAYETRVSHEVSQSQPVAPVAPLAGGRPEFESYAQTPAGWCRARYHGPGERDSGGNRPLFSPGSGAESIRGA